MPEFCKIKIRALQKSTPGPDLEACVREACARIGAAIVGGLAKAIGLRAPYLLTSLPFQLRPGGDVLILEPRGGLDVFLARVDGAQSITAVEPNIHAGTKYMDQLMTQYFPDVNFTENNRTLFAFASYNAGPGNVSKMRKDDTTALERERKKQAGDRLRAIGH